MTLALTSYEPVTWEVQVGTGSLVETVILGGSRAAVKGLPESATIVEAFGDESKSRRLPYAGHEIDSQRFRLLVDALAKLTELPIASFRGAYRYEHGAPLVVDRVQQDQRLAYDFPKPAPRDSLPSSRFTAMQYLPGRFPHESRVSYGEFTWAGPDVESLRPVPQGASRVAHDAAGQKYYAIGGHGVIEIEADFKTAHVLDLGLDVPRLSWPSDITFDSKRRRVLLTSSGGGGYLYAYDIAQKQWSALMEKHGVECITYHPDHDVLFGIGLAMGSEAARPDLCRLDMQGKLISRTPMTGIPAGSLSGGPGVCGIQLAPAGRHLALVASPHGVRPRSSERNETLIYLVDPDRAQARLTSKSGGEQKLAVTVPEDPARTEAQASAEVHIIGLYEGQEQTGGKLHGGRATVTVNRPGKRVTLVLTSYEPVSWQVNSSPDSRIEKVILGGYERQVVKGLPEDVPVVEAFRQDGAAVALGYSYRIDSMQFRQLVDGLAKLTDAPIASFQGAYRPAGGFVVDRVQNDPRLAYDYPRPAVNFRLPDLRFKAFYHLPGGNRFEAQSSYGDFTLAGPVPESLVPVPGRVARMVHDPASGKYFGIQNHDVVEIDWEAKSVTKLDLGLDVPKLSWPSDLTFDTRRQRLLLKSSGGGGYLYAYHPARQAWSVVMEKPGVELIAHHPQLDALFGIALPHSEEGNRPVLVRFNQHGAIVRQFALEGPIIPGSVDGGPGAPRSQLIAVDKYLVLLATRDPRRSGGEGSVDTLLYLIHPEAGQVSLTWRETVAGAGQ